MQIDARDWIFEVSEDPSAGVPVWSQILGIESFTLSNSDGEESTDTTTFESAGVAESQAMQRGASLNVDGKIKRAADGITQDAGQLSCDTLAALVGEASLGGVRFRHTLDTDWIVWDAWVSRGDNGGGKNDKTSWSAKFMRSGPATTEAVV
jgi:hypothetical protein